MSQARKFDLAPRSGIPEWMVKLRSAAFDAITENDVKQIMQKQVELAKTGDHAAVKMVFDYLLGGKSSPQQATTLTQNNLVIKTNGKPGTSKKIDDMRRRAESGLPLHNEDDPAFGDCE